MGGWGGSNWWFIGSCGSCGVGSAVEKGLGERHGNVKWG